LVRSVLSCWSHDPRGRGNSGQPPGCSQPINARIWRMVTRKDPVTFGANRAQSPVMKAVTRNGQIMSDQELRFAELYRRYGKHLHAYCLRRTPDPRQPTRSPRPSWSPGKGSNRFLMERTPSLGCMRSPFGFSPINGDTRRGVEDSSNDCAGWPMSKPHPRTFSSSETRNTEWSSRHRPG